MLQLTDASACSKLRSAASALCEPQFAIVPEITPAREKRPVEAGETRWADDGGARRMTEEGDAIAVAAEGADVGRTQPSWSDASCRSGPTCRAASSPPSQP